MKDKLYFIPGTMCDQQLWSHIWPELEHSFELVHLAVPEKTELTDIISDLSAQLDAKNVNLVGFSMGGYLATCLAQNQPERFAKVLVLSNSPCRLPQAELQQRQQTLQWLQKFAYRGITPAKINVMLAQHNRDNKQIHRLITEMERNLGYHQLALQLGATSEREDKSEFLLQQQLEMHFAFGDQDHLVDQAWLTALANKAGYGLTRVPNCGHMLPLEQPKDLIQIVSNTFKSE